MKNFYKRISATIIAIAMTIMMLPISESATVFAGSIIWDGTPDTDWYVGHESDTNFSISTAEELAGLASLVNGGNNFSGKTINLENNLVLNDTSNWENWGTNAPLRTWTAIGHKTLELHEIAFTGTFDGQGHTVSGIYINKTITNVTGYYQGLFGISYGTIKNVGIINSYIKGYSIVGGVVGKNDTTNGRIENCYNSGTITTGSYNHAGGVAGNNLGTITNCYNTGEVMGASYVGGITGYAQYATTTNCYNTGAVNASGNNVGGIVGSIWGGTLSNCYNTGVVTATGGNIGGVAGSNDNSGTITNSYYYGCNAGVGGTGALQTGTIPFATIVNNPLGINKTTTITELTNMNDADKWNNALGADFAVAFSDTYSSSDTGVATLSGTTITGALAGNADITGRTMTITQNGLTSAGFTGTTTDITVPISMTLSVTAGGGGATVEIIPSITMPDNITLAIGEDISGISFSNGGYIYFVKSGETVTSYADLQALHINDLAECRNYMSLNPEDKIDIDLGVGVYDIYVVNVNNFLIAKSDKTLTITSPYTNGTGTEADPYWVTNPIQLRAMKAFENTSFVLKNDIDLSSIPNWEPIFFENNNLEGNYHNITGLTVDSDVIKSECAGLFSIVYYSTVKHLGIIDANVKNPELSGILAANVDNSHIEEVFTTGTVEGTLYVGGLIGVYIKAGDTVLNCYSTATVKGENYVGGLIGGMDKSSIITSYSAGQVIVEDTASSTGFGGFLGTDKPLDFKNPSTFVSNYFDNEVSGQSSSIGATGKTTSQMKTKATFLAGTGQEIWDFTNVWAISSTYNNGYPYLKGFHTENIDPPTPDTTTDPVPDPEPTIETKTLKIIETPVGIKNPEKISVKPVGEAFNKSVEVRMKDDPTVKALIETSLTEKLKEKANNITIFPLDISLYEKGTDTKVQPNAGTSVTITCPIPESLLADKDSVKVVCIIDDKLTVLETKIVEIDGVWCAEFNATHFSPYAMVVDKTNALSGGGETDVPDTSKTSETTKNPITGENTKVETFSLIAILSVATFVVVSKKRKFKLVKKG